MNANGWNGQVGRRLLPIALAVSFLIGCEDQLLPPEPGEAPPPSNLRIYYVDTTGSWAGETSIWAVRSDGGDLRRVAPGLLGFAPRGDMIAYYTQVAQAEPGIYVANRDGTGAALRVAGAPNGRMLLPNFALSGDGTIAALSLDYYDTAGPVLWLELASLTSTRSVLIGVGYSGSDDNPAPRFSPDGRSVAMIATNDSYQSALLVIDVATGQIDTVADVNGTPSADSFDWSPDGRRLVFSSAPDGESLMVAVDRASGELDTIIRSKPAFILPRWHPDGSRLFYVQVIEGGADVFSITLDGRVRRLTSSPMSIEYMVDVAPDGSALLIGSIDPFSEKSGVSLSILDLRTTLTTRTIGSYVIQAMWGR